MLLERSIVIYKTTEASVSLQKKSLFFAVFEYLTQFRSKRPRQRIRLFVILSETK